LYDSKIICKELYILAAAWRKWQVAEAAEMRSCQQYLLQNPP